MTLKATKGEMQALINATGYPGHGKPCNGCGLCCIADPCGVARALFTIPEGDHCPALELDEHKKFRCGIMAHPEKHLPAQSARATPATVAAAMKFLMGAGEGCDLPMTGISVDPAYQRSVDEKMYAGLHAAMNAAAALGITPLDFLRLLAKERGTACGN